MTTITVINPAALPPLTTPKYTVDDFGLHINAPLSYDEWVEVGAAIWQWRSAIQWAIGDWIAYGEDHFSEDSAQAITITEYSQQTIANYASVSRVFPPERRTFRLSHSHYDAARGLRLEDGRPDKAAQDALLGQAVSEEWSREDVREEVRKRKPKPTPPALPHGGNDTPPKLPPTYDELADFVCRIALADLHTDYRAAKEQLQGIVIEARHMKRELVGAKTIAA